MLFTFFFIVFETFLLKSVYISVIISNNFFCESKNRLNPLTICLKKMLQVMKLHNFGLVILKVPINALKTNNAKVVDKPVLTKKLSNIYVQNSRSICSEIG